MIFIQLFVFCMIAVLSSGPCSAGEVLTLPEAIGIAVAENPLVVENRHQVEAFEQAKKAASGQRLPQLAFHASAERLSDPQAVAPSTNIGGKQPLFSRDHYAAGVSFRLPLYEGGILYRRVAVAKLSTEESQLTLRRATQEVIANVTNTFNQSLYLKGLIVAQDDTLTALRKSKDDSSVKLKVGRIAPVDLMRIETQVAEQEQSLIRSREEERRSRQTLALLLGRDPSRAPDTAGKLTVLEPLKVETAVVQPEQIAEMRPDVQASMREVEKAETAVKLASGLHLPSVGVVAGYNGAAGRDLIGDEDRWSAGLSVDMNLFSGGTISAKVKQARATLAAARQRKRQAELNARTEIVHAISNLREARHRLQVAASARATAEESYRIEELRYRKGSGTVTDSLLAQAAWLESRANELAALFDVQVAGVGYRLAAGTIDRDQGIAK